MLPLMMFLIGWLPNFVRLSSEKHFRNESLPMSGPAIRINVWSLEGLNMRIM